MPYPKLLVMLVQAMTIKLYPSIINYVKKRGIMTNENRGLASSGEETRQRVAREGGKASHGGGRKI